jgi:hypothetical protein
VKAIPRRPKPGPALLSELYAEPYLVYLVRTLMEDEPQLSFFQAFQRAHQRMGEAA